MVIGFRMELVFELGLQMQVVVEHFSEVKAQNLEPSLVLVEVVYYFVLRPRYQMMMVEIGLVEPLVGLGMV